jgi:vancomycin resistance protein YoaR
MKKLKFLFFLILPTFFLLFEKSLAQENSMSAFFDLSEIELTVEDKKQIIQKEILSSWIREETQLLINSDYRSEIENVDFCVYQKSLLCRLTLSRQNEARVQKKYFRETEEQKIKEYLTTLAKKYNREPENAKLKMENGRATAFSLSKSGMRLDEEKSLEIIKSNLLSTSPQKELSLTMNEIPSEVSIDSIDNLGITELIGQGRSNFRGSSVNRIFNIQVAVKKFDGLLIKPGEEFSFVKNLGKVDETTGYRPELVIKKDKTELDYGGGVCQLSTTAFRAAIHSGLEITARRNHAYPVSYYNPPGMDATIYVPFPDLKFKNNTPSHILIEIKIEGTELIFNFYGTSDGRRVNVIGPRVTEKNPDGSMKTVFNQQVFDKNDQLLFEEVFRSAYDSPDNYPRPDSTILTKKPDDWSKKEWEIYKKTHNLR